MPTDHFHVLEKELRIKMNSLECFSRSEYFLDDTQLKRIEYNSDFSADTLLASEKLCSVVFSLIHASHVSTLLFLLFCVIIELIVTVTPLRVIVKFSCMINYVFFPTKFSEVAFLLLL